MAIYLPLELLVHSLRYVLATAGDASQIYHDTNRRRKELWKQALDLRLVCRAFDDACMLYLFGIGGEDVRDAHVYRMSSRALRERAYWEKVRSGSQQPLPYMIREAANTLSALQDGEWEFFARQGCFAASLWLQFDEIFNLHRWKIPRGCTPLKANVQALAAFTGRVELLGDLSGADLDAGCAFLGTPLIAAASSGSLDTIRSLVLAKAAVNHQYGLNKFRGTPIVAAALYGYFDAVGFLLDEGACLDPTEEQFRRDCIAISAAAYNGHTKVVNLLVPKYALSTNSSRIYGHGLTSAIKGHHEEIGLFLLKLNGDPIFCDRESAMNAFALAASCGCDEVIQRMLDMGAPINYWQEPKSPNSPALTWAALEGHVSTVQLLLDAGADVNLQYKRRGTALHAAVTSRNLEIASLLLQYGANPNPTTDWSAWPKEQFTGHPLDGAVHFGLAEIAELLVEHGATLENPQNNEDLAVLLPGRALEEHLAPQS